MGRAKVGTEKGIKRKAEKDPNKPKRATTAYFYFLAAERELAKKEGRETNKIAEFTKAVSVKWRALAVLEKKVYEDKAAKDKKRYADQMAIYTGKAATDPDKPKRPQSGYFLFLADFREKNKSKYEHKELLKKAGEEWNGLTPTVKKPYEQKAEEGRKNYEKAMKDYASGSPAKKAKVETNNGAAEEDDEEEDESEEEEDESEEEDE